MNEPHDPNVTADITPAQPIREADPLGTVDHVHASASTDETQPSSDAPATDLPTVPGYRVLREIAHGGMGRVLAAHDLTLDREVALKIMLPGANVDRFVRESKITARLPHPGIPPVYALGTLADGSPFLAMKLVAGQTLAVELKTAERPRLLQAFAQVCQAVGFAHSRGVIHRDLKPTNVMVGAFGEVQVMDWGLAKEGTSAEPAVAMPVEFAGPLSGETQAGSVLGTPGYMAPEQARGEIDSLDERCDVFGLGAILCVILTGRPAYAGQSRQEMMARAMKGDLSDALARLAACGADAELIDLAQKCLAAEKGQRPRDAGAVAAAVAEYQAQVQERLKKAELDRAAARAREQEAQATATAERKARRRTGVALAVSLVSAAVLVGGGAWYYRDQQVRANELTRRRTETEQAVTPALLKAEHLGDQAAGKVVESSQDAANALVVWQQALDALGQAEAALLTGLPNDSLTNQVENARRRIAEGQARYHHLLTQALRREKLFRDLDDARMATATWKEAHFDLAGAAVKFAAAFREFGLDVQPGHTEDLAQRIREQERSVRDALLVALDQWAVCVTAPLKTDLLNIARAADTDAWRADYRQAVGSRNGAELVRLNREPRRFTLPPASIQLLAVALQNTEHQEEALELLRWARGPYASDFWIVYLLGNYLGQEPGTLPTDVEEQIGCFRVAVALRPDASAARNNLGAALYVKNRLDDAIAEYDKAIALNPKHAPAHHNRGVALADKYQLDDAIAEYNMAIALDPKDASSHNSLGNAFLSKNRRDDAIAEFNKAIAIDPKFALAHDNLGRALQANNQLDDAIAEYRKAIALNPKYAAAHYNLGYILMATNQLDEAVAEFNKSIVHDPKRVATHYELGVALQAKHQFDDAITAYGRAKPPSILDSHCRISTSVIFCLPGISGTPPSPNSTRQSPSIPNSQGATSTWVGRCRPRVVWTTPSPNSTRPSHWTPKTCRPASTLALHCKPRIA